MDVCTVTILPGPLLAQAPSDADGPLCLRVACNRDELLTRAPALPPITWRAGERVAVMPVDPESGGTWIGANDAGLVCVVLNASDGACLATDPLSRGTIIPPLLACATTDAALTTARGLSAARYRPFRLLVVKGNELVECWTHHGHVECRRETLRTAVLRTSSSLGDATVRGPRTALFRAMLGSPTDAVAAQDGFHRHHWPDREAVSVCMRRSDARTVSHTIVEVRQRSVRLAYRAVDSPDTICVTVAA